MKPNEGNLIKATISLKDYDLEHWSKYIAVRDQRRIAKAAKAHLRKTSPEYVEAVRKVKALRHTIAQTRLRISELIAQAKQDIRESGKPKNQLP